MRIYLVIIFLSDFLGEKLEVQGMSPSVLVQFIRIIIIIFVELNNHTKQLRALLVLVQLYISTKPVDE